MLAMFIRCQGHKTFEAGSFNQMKTNLNTLIYTLALVFASFATIGLSPTASATVLSVPHNTSTTAINSDALPIIKVDGHRNRNQQVQRQRNRNRANRGYNRNRIQNRNRVRNRNRHRGRVRNHRSNRNRFAYRSNRHGPRFRRQRGRNRFYNNGFWYVSPFWLGQSLYNGYYGNDYYGDDYYEPQGNSHTRWCLNRYRSYNPRTDTFRGYDGYDHKCRSPY